MKFAIIVNEGPYTHQSSDTAYQFAKATLAKGHEIVRVFFYHDGVNNGTKLAVPPQDDRHIPNNWAQLGKDTDNVIDGFRISGLGQLIEAGIQADRTITFGD